MKLNVNENYQNILKLERILTELEIPHRLERNKDGWTIIRLNREGERDGDVATHLFTYGNEIDLMEAYQFEECDGDVIGYLDINHALLLFLNARIKDMEG